MNGEITDHKEEYKAKSKDSEEKEWDVAKEKWEIDALDKDLWFKASEGAKDATATDIELHKNTHIEDRIYIYRGVGCSGIPPVMGLLWSV